MSGGSYDCVYHRFEEFGRAMLKCKEPFRKAFGQHLLDISAACHDIEWVDSGDMTAGDEKEAIMKCITKKDICDALVNDAQMMVDELQAWIYEVNDA